MQPHSDTETDGSTAPSTAPKRQTNRKLILALLGLPIVVTVVYLAVIPAETREAFLQDFSHRIAGMLGNEPEPLGDELGLRLEHPEEYGLGGEEAEEGTEEKNIQSDTEE